LTWEDFFGEKTCYHAVVARDYEVFSQAVVAGEIDIFLMGPSLFTEIHTQHPDKIRLAAS